jgi:hypothetical protein
LTGAGWTYMAKWFGPRRGVNLMAGAASRQHLAYGFARTDNLLKHREAVNLPVKQRSRIGGVAQLSSGRRYRSLPRTTV